MTVSDLKEVLAKLRDDDLVYVIGDDVELPPEALDPDPWDRYVDWVPLEEVLEYRARKAAIKAIM